MSCVNLLTDNVINYLDVIQRLFQSVEAKDARSFWRDYFSIEMDGVIAHTSKGFEFSSFEEEDEDGEYIGTGYPIPYTLRLSSEDSRDYGFIYKDNLYTSDGSIAPLSDVLMKRQFINFNGSGNFISKFARIGIATTIGNNTAIGNDVTLGRGCTVSDTSLNGITEIADGGTLTKCTIVDSAIRGWAVLANATLHNASLQGNSHIKDSTLTHTSIDRYTNVSKTELLNCRIGKQFMVSKSRIEGMCIGNFVHLRNVTIINFAAMHHPEVVKGMSLPTIHDMVVLHFDEPTHLPALDYLPENHSVLILPTKNLGLSGDERTYHQRFSITNSARYLIHVNVETMAESIYYLNAFSDGEYTIYTLEDVQKERLYKGIDLSNDILVGMFTSRVETIRTNLKNRITTVKGN